MQKLTRTSLVFQFCDATDYIADTAAPALDLEILDIHTLPLHKIEDGAETTDIHCEAVLHLHIQ
jgi:hypothetical protein